MALSPKTAKEIARAEERAAKSAERAAKASKERAAVEKDLTEYAKIRHQLSLKGIGKAEYLAAKAQAREEKKITKEKEKQMNALKEVEDIGASIGKLMQEQNKSTGEVARHTKSWKGVVDDIGKEAQFISAIDKKRFALAKSGLSDLDDVYTNAQNVGTEYFQTFDFTKKINAARKLGLDSLADEYEIAQRINDANKRKHQIIETAGKQMLKPFEALDTVIRKLPMGDLLADVLGVKLLWDL
jgi:vacuolar-type H+-ATPase subunit I/STV1